MAKQLKVFGERNTGTNYITDLILLNYPVHILSDGPPYWWEKRFGLSGLSMECYFLLTAWRNLGWKHAVPKLSKRQTQSTNFVVVTKNPYSWLLSLHKRPYHNWESRNLSFNEFLMAPWPLMRCDGINAESLTPTELWNIKNQSYLRFVDSVDTAILVRYESVLEDPATLLHELSLLVGYPLEENFQLLDKGAKSSDKHKTFNEYRDYYLNELWREKLSAEDLARINQSLDPDLVRRLGYSIIDPTLET